MLTKYVSILLFLFYKMHIKHLMVYEDSVNPWGLQYIKQSDHIKLWMAQASEIVNWFNNHSLVLHLLYSEQRTLPEFKGIAKTLIRGCITRWSSHVMSLQRLLELKQPLRSLVVKSSDTMLTAVGARQELIHKAQQIINIINSECFWNDIEA
jgi:hypothetical protein